jgi:Zinc knuckle
MASTRKGKAAASSKSTHLTLEEEGTPQDLAAELERQPESDYDDAPEEASSRTLNAQVQELARNQSATETILQSILQRITELSGAVRDSPSARLPTASFPPGPPRPTIERDTPFSTGSATYSKKLPDPTPLSDGKDPTFLSWKIQIQGKFRSNADHYPHEEDKMLYLFNRTSGDAQKHLQPRYDEDSQTRFTSAKDMLEYLASIYVNPNHVRDARASYNTLSMKQSQAFSVFQTEFLHLAGEAQVPRESLRMDLYDRLTTELQRGLAANLPRIESYEELAAYASSLDSELKRIAIREERQKRYREKLPARLQVTSGPSATHITSTRGMPTPSYPSQRLRADTPRTEPRRLTPAEAPIICYNCGEPGHKAPACPRPPKGDLKEIEETEEDSYDELRTEESGNEEP